MPFRRRMRRRRVVRRRRGISYGQIGRKIWRDVKWLKSVVNVEKKYIDTTATTTSPAAGAFVLLNGCTTGTSAITRDGQSIKMVSIYENYFWSINAAAATTYVRTVIVLDRQANGAAPSFTDIFVNSGVLSAANIGNSKRFKIVHDTRKTLSLNGNEMVRHKKFTKCSIHTEYNTGSAGTIADIQTNSLYLFHMSDQGANVPGFSYFVRVRFIDN